MLYKTHQSDANLLMLVQFGLQQFQKIERLLFRLSTQILLAVLRDFPVADVEDLNEFLQKLNQEIFEKTVSSS